MNWLNNKYLTDENIDRDIVTYLSSKGCDVKSVFDMDLQGKTDAEVIERSITENRVILTHDSDFGTLIFKNQIPFIGIIYLRPGHIDITFTISTLETIFESDLEPDIPFIIIAQRTEDNVKIRLRNL